MDVLENCVFRSSDGLKMKFEICITDSKMFVKVYFMCINVLPLCMYVCHMCAGSRDMGGCQPCCGPCVRTARALPC